MFSSGLDTQQDFNIWQRFCFLGLESGFSESKTGGPLPQVTRRLGLAQLEDEVKAEKL